MVKTIIKAFIIGSTMMVPGLSGGSMAMVLSIYADLINALSDFRKDIKKNLAFLATFCASALVGMFLLAKPILSIIERFPIVSMYFFIGLVVGSIPTIFKSAKVDKLNFKDILAFIVGLVIVLSIGALPEGLFTFTEISFIQVLIQMVGGFVVAIGFMLPGISLSYLLLVLGLYSYILEHVASLNILPLIPFALGFGLGCILTVKGLKKALEQYPRISYLTILGFLTGSLVPVYPGLPNTAVEWGLSIVLFIIGVLAIYFLSKIEQSKEALVSDTM